MGEESLGPNAVEYGGVNIQGFEVDTRGEVGVKTLSETFTNCQLERDDRVLGIRQQHLGTRNHLERGGGGL